MHVKYTCIVVTDSDMASAAQPFCQNMNNYMYLNHSFMSKYVNQY